MIKTMLKNRGIYTKYKLSMRISTVTEVIVSNEKMNWCNRQFFQKGKYQWEL